MSTENKGSGNAPEKVIRRKPVPIAMAKGPYEYIQGDQELPVQLTVFWTCCNGRRIGLARSLFGRSAMVWPVAQSR